MLMMITVFGSQQNNKINTQYIIGISSYFHLLDNKKVYFLEVLRTFLVKSCSKISIVSFNDKNYQSLNHWLTIGDQSGCQTDPETQHHGCWHTLMGFQKYNHHQTFIWISFSYKHIRENSRICISQTEKYINRKGNIFIMDQSPTLDENVFWII